jgi:hypothetical protein
MIPGSARASRAVFGAPPKTFVYSERSRSARAPNGAREARALPGGVRRLI